KRNRSFVRSNFRRREVVAKLRKIHSQGGRPHRGVPRDQNDTNIFWADRGDIGLRIAAPVDFHAIRPRLNTIVTPEGETRLGLDGTIQCTPSPYTGTNPIGSHDPPRPNGLSADADALRREPGNTRPPHLNDADLFRLLDHSLVQNRPSQTDSLPGWKTSIDLSAFS